MQSIFQNESLSKQILEILANSLRKELTKNPSKFRLQAYVNLAILLENRGIKFSSDSTKEVSFIQKVYEFI